MALGTPTNLLNAAYTGTNLTSQATGSISPTANALILVDLAFTGGSVGMAQAPTLSGNGITWTLVAEQASSSGVAGERMFRFQGLNASPSAGAITVTRAAAPGTANFNTMNVSITQITGADTSTPLLGANTAQGTDESDTANQAYDQAMTSGNLLISASAAWEADATWTPRSGWTELSDRSDVTAPGPALCVQYRTTTDTACGGLCSAVTYLATIGSEVVAAAAGGTTVNATGSEATTESGTPSVLFTPGIIYKIRW